MTTKWTTGLAVLLMVASLVTACGKDDHADHKHDSGGSVKGPANYKAAVAKCEELSKKIGELIEAGKLDKVHAAANDIKKIAEKLPEMAQKQLAAEHLKEINVKSKELAGMFSDIDKAADSGNKAETIKLHGKMKSLIADLKKHDGQHNDKDDGQKNDHQD